MIKLFKEGAHMSIATTAPNENDFIDEISTALELMIEHEKFKGDWHFQFLYWIPMIVEICTSYRKGITPIEIGCINVGCQDPLSNKDVIYPPPEKLPEIKKPEAVQQKDEKSKCSDCGKPISGQGKTGLCPACAVRINRSKIKPKKQKSIREGKCSKCKKEFKLKNWQNSSLHWCPKCRKSPGYKDFTNGE